MLNFIKIGSVGAEFFHADERTDGQADMMSLTFAFRNFAKAHKNYLMQVCAA
jgi:hypothetical protein